jgi:hypothetical protein
MTNFVRDGLRVLVLLVVFTAPSAALAGKWVVEVDPFGSGYVVTDHETSSISTKTKRAAKKIARILNHAGFVDPGTGPCHDPRPGTQC